MDYSYTNHEQSKRENESGTGAEDATDPNEGTGHDETWGQGYKSITNKKVPEA
jgi:hypothetical protein